MLLSVQCFTLRNEFDASVDQALTDIAKIGFKYIETAGTNGLPASEFAKKITDSGLQVSGMHVGLGDLENRLPELLEEADALDSPHLILPWIGEADYAAGWDQFAIRLTPIASAIVAAGRNFAYHNHVFEFATQQDMRTGFDTLFDSASQSVGAEIDVWWAHCGRENPADLIRRHRTRTPLIHLKDGTSCENDIHAPAGLGILNWDEILAACHEIGVQFGVVELDNSPGSAMEAVRVSHDFFRSKDVLD